jgi:protein involved in polysaccharide export with SLBB domain
VVIYSTDEIKGEQIVRISGFLDEPKTIFWRENLSVFDLIFQSTSFEELEFRRKLLTSRVDVKRFNPAIGQFEIKTYSLDRLEEIKNTFLIPRDEVILFSKSVTEITDQKVRVVGYVNTPGAFTLVEGMKIEDAILQAGGFKEYAEQNLIIVNREKFNFETGQLSERFELVPDRDYLLGLATTSKTDFLLEHNDIISVRKMEGVQPVNTIRIEGAIRFPGSVVLEQRTDNFQSLVEKAGGFREDAYLPGSYILRDSKVLSIDLSKLRNVQNNFLQDGDEVVILQKSGSVEVVGAVENEAVFVWKEGSRARYYLRNAGGKVKKEGWKAYAIQSNGLTKSVSFLSNPRVMPDSRILVNRKPPKEKSDKPFIYSFVQVLSVTTGAITTLLLIQRLD